MATRAADDVDTIYQNLRRNRVIEAGFSAGLANAAMWAEGKNLAMWLGDLVMVDETSGLQFGFGRFMLAELLFLLLLPVEMGALAFTGKSFTQQWLHGEVVVCPRKR